MNLLVNCVWLNYFLLATGLSKPRQLVGIIIFFHLAVIGKHFLKGSLASSQQRFLQKLRLIKHARVTDVGQKVSLLYHLLEGTDL